ncbi:MAG TPA: hypothetical protein VF026_27340 [Ktedonobacteraceae bacterium]
MQNTTIEAPRRRPLGVSIIAVLAMIQGIFFLIFGILALGAAIAAANSGGTATVTGYAITGAAMSVVAGVLAGIFLVVGLVSFLFAWGLWTLKRWAFWATVTIQIISLLISGILALGAVIAAANGTGTTTITGYAITVNSVFIFTHPRVNIWSIVVDMIIPIVILVYFLADSNVRAAFRT